MYKSFEQTLVTLHAFEIEETTETSHVNLKRIQAFTDKI